LIGDLHTAALIGERGTLAWLCLPDFDSEACFAGLLGTEDHGAWSLAPRNACEVKRRYLPDTLIIETVYTQRDAVASVTDFMAVHDGHSCVIRIVRGLKGRVIMRTRFAPRFDYGSGRPRIEAKRSGHWSIVSGPHRLTLRSNAPMVLDSHDLAAEWPVRFGETHYFTLQYSNSYSDPEPPKVSPRSAQGKTARFWRKWIGGSTYRGQYREAVERSLITLKALTYAPSGGLVAAPTTSLPEKIGGIGNWDYRFCWLRDSTFSLQVLTECGLNEDARAWLGWLNRSVQSNPHELKIMYGITGKREHSEWKADWLPGYRHSKPVHIGNKASDQLQLDTYGEVLDSLYRSRCKALYPQLEVGDTSLVVPLLQHLEKIWGKPDAGLWEFRTPCQHFTHSKVMAWVAFDRGIRMAEEFGTKGPADRWRRLRSRIHKEVCDKGFNKKMKTFTQAYGTRHLDASLLLIPAVGFLDIEDDRVTGTVEAIEKHLMRDGLLLRYDTRHVPDGLPPGEGSFLACNFWLIDVYILQGRMDEARSHFEKLLKYRNRVGLLSEEYDAQNGLVGNFPQAFSHVGLVNAALSLDAGASVRLRDLQRPQLAATPHSV
jgi:GH15 family glucan-1,4-alpha-glucosidase